MEAAMTTADVMQALAVLDPQTVYSLVKTNRLPAVRLGREYRFDPEAVRAFIRGDDPGEAAEAAKRRRAGWPAWARNARRTIKR